MRKPRHWIVFLFSLPAVIVSWLVFCILCICYVVYKPTLEPGFILSGQWRPWVAKFWRFSNAFGRVTIYQHNAISGSIKRVHQVMSHEHVHIRQTEDDMLKACVVGIIAGLLSWNFWIFVGIWSSGFIWLLVSYLASLCRYGWSGGYKRVYRQAEHERAAYLETELDGTGLTYLEKYEKQY